MVQRGVSRIDTARVGKSHRPTKCQILTAKYDCYLYFMRVGVKIA